MRRSPLAAALGVASLLCFASAGSAGGAPAASTHEAEAQQAPTEAIVKRFITKQEERLATGVGSSHKSVTVTFESVRFGQKRAANARDRVVNGITGKTLYPVRVQYTSHRTWGNGETEAKKIHYGYEFYVDEFGEWTASLVGPVA